MLLGRFFCNCVFDVDDFTDEQLQEIKRGLIDGIDVDYALPTLSIDEMRQRRESKIKKHVIRFATV